MCGKKEFFAELKDGPYGSVSLGDSSKFPVEGKGKIKIIHNYGREEYISDTYYIPSMKSNILSIGQLLQKGYVIHMEEHEGTGDSEVFRQTHPRSQYGESKKKPHALTQTFLLPRGDGDLRKKIPVVHGSTQDPLVLQLLEEVNKLKTECQAEIPDWNQPKPDPLTRRILDTPFKRRQNKSLSTMAYRMHTNEEQCLLFPSTLSSGALNWYCRLPLETVDSFEELRKLFVSQHIFQTDRLHSTDDLYTIHQKPDESLREYAGRFSQEYSLCTEVDDKTALKAFMAYNNAFAEARTYQGNLHIVNPYQQVWKSSSTK
ncbi:hypothetical protein ACFX2B_044951 [Malus domestica]